MDEKAINADKIKATIYETKKRLKFKSIYIPILLMNLLLLLILGILDYIDAEFSLEVFKSANYWTNLGVSYATVIIMTASTLMICIDNFCENNQEYLKIQKSIQDFTQAEYRPSLFQRFLKGYNRVRKKNAWRQRIILKLDRLERFRKEKDALIWEFGTEEEKRQNKYCQKRRKLELELSEDWIEKNIDIINLKYNVVSSNLVIGGEGRNINYEDDDYITTNKVWKVVKDKTPIMLLSFAIITLFSSIITEFNFDVTFFIKTSSKLATVCCSVYTTIRYSKNYNKSVTLHDILFRWGVCCEYKAWLQAQVKEGKSNDGQRENNQIRTNSFTTISNGEPTAEQCTDNIHTIPG